VKSCSSQYWATFYSSRRPAGICTAQAACLAPDARDAGATAQKSDNRLPLTPSNAPAAWWARERFSYTALSARLTNWRKCVTGLARSNRQRRLSTIIPSTSRKVFWGCRVVICSPWCDLVAHHLQPYLRDLRGMLSRQFAATSRFRLSRHCSFWLSGKGVFCAITAAPTFRRDFDREFSARKPLEIPVRPWHLPCEAERPEDPNPSSEKREGSLFGSFKSKREVKIRIDELNSDDADSHLSRQNRKAGAPVCDSSKRNARHGPATARLSTRNHQDKPPERNQGQRQFVPGNRTKRALRPSAPAYTSTRLDLNVFKGIREFSRPPEKLMGCWKRSRSRETTTRTSP